jgi:hypothetical protein
LASSIIISLSLSISIPPPFIKGLALQVKLKNVNGKLLSKNNIED